jgi:hypothetical protein
MNEAKKFDAIDAHRAFNHFARFGAKARSRDLQVIKDFTGATFSR